MFLWLQPNIMNKDSFAIESGPKGSGVVPITTLLMIMCGLSWIKSFYFFYAKWEKPVENDDE